MGAQFPRIELSNKFSVASRLFSLYCLHMFQDFEPSDCEDVTMKITTFLLFIFAEEILGHCWKPNSTPFYGQPKVLS